MKLISWNVNGLRACLTKGFGDFFLEMNADVFCIQETKMHPEQAEVEFDGYKQYWNSAVKKGYSGTAIFSKTDPLSVSYDLGSDKHNDEGRTITLEFEAFYLVTVYTPNAQNKLARIDYRMEWEDDFQSYLLNLEKKKPVILCGDLNVAHKEIDLKNPKANMNNAGFSIQEREKMKELLSNNFVDSYRFLYPEEKGSYTWWSYMYHARDTNAGWRIDYFIVSDKLKNQIKDSIIHKDIMGSDHCPVELDIEV